MKEELKFTTSDKFESIGLISGMPGLCYSGVWGTVCDDEWDMQDADVVCRQLGYPAAYGYRSSAFYGEGSDKVWMDNVQCEGDELTLQTCLFNGWGDNDCEHSEDAGVVCCKSHALLCGCFHGWSI